MNNCIKNFIFQKQAHLWFVLGVILLLFRFHLFPIDSYISLFFLTLRAFVFGGAFAVVLNRFKFVGFACMFFALMVIFWIYSELLPTLKPVFYLLDWLLDDLMTIQMRLSVFGLFCLATSLIKVLNDDQVIFKLSVTFFSIMAIPALVLYMLSFVFVNFGGIGMGLIFGFLYIPFILFMLVMGGYWILSGDIRKVKNFQSTGAVDD